MEPVIGPEVPTLLPHGHPQLHPVPHQYHGGYVPHPLDHVQVNDKEGGFQLV